MKIPYSLFVLLLEAVKETFSKHIVDSEIDEVTIDPFFLWLIARILFNHPETEVASYYRSEIKRLLMEEL